MKSVSATEAKNRLGALINEVASTASDVVIENHGRPRAVLISFEDYRVLLEAREQQRRRDALDALRTLRGAVLEQNRELSVEAANQLVEEISADTRARSAGLLRCQMAE